MNEEEIETIRKNLDKRYDEDVEYRRELDRKIQRQKEEKKKNQTMTPAEKLKFIEQRNWDGLSNSQKLEEIEKLYAAITQPQFESLSADQKEFFQRYKEHYPTASTIEIMAIIKPPKDIDPDLFATKMQLVTHYKNEIRARHNLDALPNQFLTNSDIEELISAGAVQDFLDKQEVLPSGKVFKPNSPLRERITQYIAKKELLQRQAERAERLEHDLKAQYQKLLEIPKQTKKENDRIVICDEFIEWQNKATALLNQVRKHCRALDSQRKDESLEGIPDKRHWLYAMERKIESLLENQKELD